VLRARALDQLARDGLLLISDRALPSLVALVTGSPVAGSWWGHPLGRSIYGLINDLEGHADILLVKLIAGKDTLVHRSLWPALLAAAQAREPWQLERLSEAAAILLRLVEDHETLRADELPWIHAVPPRRTVDAARDLERRLLVRSGQVHTETGAHARLLEAWPHWASRVGVDAGDLSPTAGKQQIEAAVRAYVAHAAVPPRAARLPWAAR
jgi:hypothetical protein